MLSRRASLGWIATALPTAEIVRRAHAAAVILVSQFACILALTALVVLAWRPPWTIVAALLVILALASAGVTAYGTWVLVSARRDSLTGDAAVVQEMRDRLTEADRLAAVGELVAGIVHDVNNPLGSISAFAQLLLRDEGLTSAQRESIEVIQSETARASVVMKDLLVFGARGAPQREPIELNALVERTLRLRGYELTSHRIAVEQVLAPDLPPIVGDARQLQHACLNLVTNAIEAMSTPAGGALSITTRTEGNNVLLEMRDTGSGISDAGRTRIFQPFFTTVLNERTTLGVVAGRETLRAPGGSIEVVETSRAGTLIRVILPTAEI